MREIFGNLWEAECDLRVITTNPMINAKGQAVMGRGCALEAKQSRTYARTIRTVGFLSCWTRYSRSNPCLIR